MLLRFFLKQRRGPFHTPGSPFAGEKAASPAVQAALEAKYGLDKPVMEQYFTYLGDIVLRQQRHPVRPRRPQGPEVDGFFSNPLGCKYFMYCTING